MDVFPLGGNTVTSIRGVYKSIRWSKNTVNSLSCKFTSLNRLYMSKNDDKGAPETSFRAEIFANHNFQFFSNVCIFLKLFVDLYGIWCLNNAF